MKKIILLTCCALFSLTVGLENAYSAQKTTRSAVNKRFNTKKNSTSKVPTTRRTNSRVSDPLKATDFSLISGKADAVCILLLKLRVADSRYLDSVRQKTANIRSQITKLSKNAQSVNRLASMFGYTSNVVKQELNEIISLIRNVEVEIQNILQAKNSISKLLQVKMDLDNAYTQVDLIGLLQIISSSVVDEFKKMEERCDTVISRNPRHPNIERYKNLRSLLEQYRTSMLNLDSTIKELVEKFQNLNININIAYTDQRSVSQLIFDPAVNGRGAHESNDEEEQIDAQGKLVSLAQDLNLQNLADAYVQYNETVTSTENILRFPRVQQQLQVMQNNLQNIDSMKQYYSQFAQAFNSFDTESLSTQLDRIEDLVNIYNNAVTAHNSTGADDQTITPISDDNLMTIKKNLLSSGFDTIINNLQTAQNPEDSSTTQTSLANAITRIQQWKSNFIDNPTWKTFSDALNTGKSTMTRLGKSANISQEVARLSSPQFRQELQAAIQKLTPQNTRGTYNNLNRLSPNNNRAQSFSTNNTGYNRGNSQRTGNAGYNNSRQFSQTNSSSSLTGYNRGNSQQSGNARYNSRPRGTANNRQSTTMPRITASNSMRGF